MCARCGTIRDVHPSGDPLADLPDDERFGFTVSDVEVTYRGICPNCAGHGLSRDPAAARPLSVHLRGRPRASGVRILPTRHTTKARILGRIRAFVFSSGDRI